MLLRKRLLSCAGRDLRPRSAGSNTLITAHCSLERSPRAKTASAKAILNQRSARMRIPIHQLVFSCCRCPNTRSMRKSRSAAFLEIVPSLRERQRTIGAAANLAGVVIILLIVFPEAHRGNLIATALMQRPAMATRAPIDCHLRERLNGITERHCYRLHVVHQLCQRDLGRGSDKQISTCPNRLSRDARIIDHARVFAETHEWIVGLIAR